VKIPNIGMAYEEIFVLLRIRREQSCDCDQELHHATLIFDLQFKVMQNGDYINRLVRFYSDRRKWNFFEKSRISYCPITPVRFFKKMINKFI
jgi:hypothetical protein